MSEPPLLHVARNEKSVRIAEALRDATNNYNSLKTQGRYCPVEYLDAAKVALDKALDEYQEFWGRKP